MLSRTLGAGRRQRKPKKDKPQPRSRAEIVSWDGVDKRSLRSAARPASPPRPRSRRAAVRIVFHDTTLRELARQKPATVDALRHIYGVGDRKVDELGDDIVATIRSHSSETTGTAGT